MRGVNLLSDKAVQAAIKKAGATDKVVTVNDGAGLTLEAQPSGAGWWRLRYWKGGKAARLSVGTYPEVSLSQARARRDDARRMVADGGDPSEARKVAKAAEAKSQEGKAREAAGLPPEGCFEAVAREWLETIHKAKVSAGHYERTKIRLENDAFPWIGRLQIDQIEAPDVLALLRKVEGRGAIETAHRIKDACSQVFRFGIATGACKRNPAADLKDALRPVQSRHHAAITDPAQVGKLLRAAWDYSGQPVTRIALLLSSLLLLRPGELRHMEWAWVDLDGAMLTVPGGAMKRTKADKQDGPPHVVPLARQAVELLRELQPFTGDGKFVFPSTTSPRTRCMSENTVRSALRRMGYGNDDMTAHGFRATARTMAAERLGIAPEVIEAQLAHTVKDSLGRAYNRTEFLEQRKALMQTWADYLDRLRLGADVVPINGKAA